jgi:hypothetical protein
MADIDVTARMADYMAHTMVTVRITDQRSYRVRLRLAIWLMRLVALVLGSGFEVEFGQRDPSWARGYGPENR